MKSVYQKAFEALTANQIEDKVALIFELRDEWLASELSMEKSKGLPDVEIAGHPEKPELVAPKNLPKRRLGTPKGIAALIHAVAHIEFNAINLACDAVYRYQNMPKAYYDDWIKVAGEEAYHFSLINERLQELGYHYGDFPAHNGLWDLAKDTRHDFRLRMALIPRVMEARGLDVTPGMSNRFAGNGEKRMVEILEIILRDEIGHVDIGSRWFHYICEQQGVDAEETYFELVAKHFPSGVTCPLNHDARLHAGFSQYELDTLEDLCAQKKQAKKS